MPLICEERSRKKEVLPVRLDFDQSNPGLWSSCAPIDSQETCVNWGVRQTGVRSRSGGATRKASEKAQGGVTETNHR